MTKRIFADHVAGLVGGVVKEIEKANGIVYTAICMPSNDNLDGSKISPVIYIDEPYESGWSIDETVAHVFNVADNNRATVNLDFVKDFDLTKDKLRVGMLNRESNVPCYIPATRYGFNDLIIYPYIRLEFDNGGSGNMKVTLDMLSQWGVDLDTVIDIGINNTNNETEVTPFVEKLISMGMPSYMAETIPANDWLIVSNNREYNGAVNVITQSAKELLPIDYIVIPSSIHEVIVVPYTEEIADNIEFITSLIGQVNDTEVKPEEVLGYKPYVIRG